LVGTGRIRASDYHRGLKELDRMPSKKKKKACKGGSGCRLGWDPGEAIPLIIEGSS